MKKGLKTLIVEDETLTRSLLASMLAVHPEVEIIGMAGSVAEARAFLERETPDVLFLDMEIAGTPGLDLLENIPSCVLTVFVSAVADHALQALDFGARGYLLKPVDSARLAIVLGRFGATPPGVPDAVAEAIEFLAANGKIHRICFEQILWVEACQNYTLVRMDDDAPVVMLSRRLGDWERMLPKKNFERLSRSLIVHLRTIRTVRWQSRDETLVDFVDCKHQLSIGRTASLRLKARLKERSAE